MPIIPWLLVFIENFSHLKCIELRDKVYGMLGLIRISDYDIAIDYGKSVYQVYADLVLAIYRTYFDSDWRANWPISHEKQVYIKALEMLFTHMDSQELHRNSLKRFLHAIWNEPRSWSFYDRPSPVTAIGFDHAFKDVPKTVGGTIS
jgi:hypothetical protein